jgi:hypothetical protein
VAEVRNVKNVVILFDMLLTESPLLLDDADRDLYIRRTEAEFWLRSATLGQGGGWLLLGAPGTGKTTLLRWLEAELRSKQAAVAWVDAGAIEGVGELVELISDPLQDNRFRTSNFDGAPAGSQAIQQQLRALRERPRSCVLIDNLADPQAGFDLFGRMRDLIWASGHSVVLSGLPESVAVLRRPPADAFFSHTMQLSPPDETMTRTLAERAGADAELVQRLLLARPPSVRTVIRYLNNPTLMAAAERWRETLTHTKPGAANVGEQILDLRRPVTAEDEELQARTGLGPIALRRYLRSLEREGLLRVLPEHGGRPGRPRLTYQPALEPEGPQ